MTHPELALSQVERALDVLEGEGARTFDAASCDCARTLLTRAEELGGEAARLLTLRANVHVERLRERFRDARAQAKQALVQFEAEHGALPSAEDALRLGDVVRARRVLRRLAHRPAVRAQVTQLPSKRQAILEYDSCVAELVAAFALARALDVVPKDAGPYNPLRIASELLTRLRTVSPIYLTAQLNRLEELASLLELPELPQDGARAGARVGSKRDLGRASEGAKALPSKKKRALKKDG